MQLGTSVPWAAVIHWAAARLLAVVVARPAVAPAAICVTPHPESVTSAGVPVTTLHSFAVYSSAVSRPGSELSNTRCHWKALIHLNQTFSQDQASFGYSFIGKCSSGPGWHS